MKKLHLRIVLLFCFCGVYHLAEAQNKLATNDQEFPKYPWMLSAKWSKYKTDNWLHKVSVEGLVEDDYSKIEILDPWGSGGPVNITFADVLVQRLDRNTKEKHLEHFEIYDGNLESILHVIEKCGSAGDSVAFQNIIIEVEGKQYQVSGNYRFEF